MGEILISVSIPLILILMVMLPVIGVIAGLYFGIIWLSQNIPFLQFGQGEDEN